MSKEIHEHIDLCEDCIARLRKKIGQNQNWIKIRIPTPKPNQIEIEEVISGLDNDNFEECKDEVSNEQIQQHNGVTEIITSINEPNSSVKDQFVNSNDFTQGPFFKARQTFSKLKIEDDHQQNHPNVYVPNIFLTMEPIQCKPRIFINTPVPNEKSANCLSGNRPDWPRRSFRGKSNHHNAWSSSEEVIKSSRDGRACKQPIVYSTNKNKKYDFEQIPIEFLSNSKLRHMSKRQSQPIIDLPPIKINEYGQSSAYIPSIYENQPHYEANNYYH
ncbi:hypothetical protein GJ496_000268 [Pomphorhynchus laevis]|nr:hypothetical protein GJ496_000268 [Pomphorhynchus laevis]